MGTKPIQNLLANMLKDLYGFPEYYEVEGAKEELIRRIKELSKAEKALYGIEEGEQND